MAGHKSPLQAVSLLSLPPYLIFCLIQRQEKGDLGLDPKSQLLVAAPRSDRRGHSRLGQLSSLSSPPSHGSGPAAAACWPAPAEQPASSAALDPTRSHKRARLLGHCKEALGHGPVGGALPELEEEPELAERRGCLGSVTFLDKMHFGMSAFMESICCRGK